MLLYKKILEVIKTVKNPKSLQVLRKERGAIVMLTALLLPVLLGFTGFAYDIGNLYMHKARLQNVADAAALAGGRAFLASQTAANVADGTNDNIDPFPGEDEGRDELEYKMTDNPNTPKSRPESNHHAADKAADAYIIKNLTNLGTNVRNDKYSHYALYSVDNPENVEPKKFYRIGIYEDVPLYFLPVIFDKKVQRVRAGAVVLLKEGTPTVIHHGGTGDASGVTSPSIFDNLFAFSEWLFTRNNSLADGTINASFSGNMVYTHLNNTSDTPSPSYYSSDPNILQPVSYFHYETSGVENDTSSYSHMFKDKVNTNISSSGGNINDPTIDLFYDTKAYLDAFKKKLDGPHVDVRSANDYTGENAFKVDERVNNDHMANSNCKYYFEKTSLQGTYFRIDGDYCLFKDDSSHFEQVTIKDDNGKTYKVCYHKFLYSDYYVRCAKAEDDDTYYLLTTENKITNCYMKMVQPQPDNPYWKEYRACIGNDQTYMSIANVNNQPVFVYSDGYNNLGTIPDSAFTPGKPTAVTNSEFQKGRVDTSENGADTNVYHVMLPRWNNEGDKIGTLEIAINKPIDGNINEPVYILVDGINQVKITGTATTTGRPVIIVFLSEGTKQIKYEFEGNEFIGTIYAPVSIFEHIQNEDNSTFRGNIIAKYINIEAGSSITWIQENHLEKYRYVYVEDASGDYVLDNGRYRKALKNETGTHRRVQVFNYIEDTNGNYIKLSNNTYRKVQEGEDVTGMTLYKEVPVYDYINNDIKAVSDSIAKKIVAANQEANLTDDLKNTIYTGLGLTQEEVEAMNNNPNWYNEQTFGRKKTLYQKWKTLYESYDANSPMRKLLWPWNEHFGIDVGEDETIIAGEILRIINFRTEFREGPKDPFIDLALDED